MKKTIALLGLAAIGALADPVAAQDPVHWKAATASTTAKAGGRVSVTLSATIDEGWHIYSITQGKGGPVPLKIVVPEGQPFALGGEIKSPLPNLKFDENFGIDVEQHEGSVVFVVPIAIAKDAKAGKESLRINARYQVCNARVCLPTQTDKLALPVTITR